MIGYVTLGTHNMSRAAAFYDALLAELGAKRLMEGDRFIAWGTSMSAPSLGVIMPFDGNPGATACSERRVGGERAHANA